MVVITPERWAFMIGSTDLIARKQPVTFAVNVRSQIAAVRFTVGVASVMPTL
jgi:Holliday junction resolvase-like predicted endonuclease